MSDASIAKSISRRVNPIVRWLHHIRISVIVRAPARYLESGTSMYASMLAFSMFIALVPLSVGVLTVFGVVADAPGHHQRAHMLQDLHRYGSTWNWEVPQLDLHKLRARGEAHREQPPSFD